VVGPPYWAAARLIQAAAHHWIALDGWCALRGTDLMALPLDRFCNAVQSWLMERVEKPELLLVELQKPPPGAAVGQNVLQEELAVVDALLGGGR
jgi:hypothetical protein